MTKADAVIKFSAQVSKVTTLVDNGWSVTLHGSEKDIETAYLMMKCKQSGGLLEIAAIAVKAKNARNSRKNQITNDISTTY